MGSRVLQRLALAVVVSPICYAFLYLVFYYGGRYLPQAGEFLEEMRRYAWIAAILLALFLVRLVY